MNSIELIKRYNSNCDEKILIIGVFHGDEPQGEYFINTFLEKKYVNKKNSLFFIPRLNNNNHRKNKNGVDLNRNFPTKNWKKEINNDYFGGDTPNSEIETQFLVDLIENNNFKAIVTIHAPYKTVNFDGPAEQLADIASRIIGYPTSSDIGYPTPGSLGTYCGKERNIPTLTIEINEQEDIEILKDKFHEFFEYLGNEYW